MDFLFDGAAGLTKGINGGDLLPQARRDRAIGSLLGRLTVATHFEPRRMGTQNESCPFDRPWIKNVIGRARFILSAHLVQLKMSRVRRMWPDGADDGDKREWGLDGGDPPIHMAHIYIYKTTKTFALYKNAEFNNNYLLCFVFYT